MEFIDLKTQYRQLKKEIDARIQRVLDHGQYIMGPEVAELEQRLAANVGVKHCIGVANGTDALLIAMMALKIGHGDEVITTPFTFIATGETIRLLGAVPVFVDVESRTYNIDPTRIEGAITPKTRAIMPVSLFGQCADIDAINAIAAKHAIPVIEDAAQSFGASYKGRRSGGLTTIGATSFFPSKPLGCYGDGGACFTNDDALATTMRWIRVHGQERRYYHPVIGMNGRLDTLQAAILLAKLDTFPSEVEARARIGERYSQLLARECSSSQCCQRNANPSAECPTNITVPWIPSNRTSVYAQYTIAVENRDSVQAMLKDAGIPTAVHYPVPLHQQPAFADLGLGKGSFPVAENAARRVISLPMHPWLTKADQDAIVSATQVAVAKFQKGQISPMFDEGQ